MLHECDVDISKTLYANIVLSCRIYSFIATAEREIARDVKEKLCYIGELPDGNFITVVAKFFHA